MLERVKRFQEFLVELGVAGSVLALPVPKTLSLEDGLSKDEGGTARFRRAVVEPEIVEVARDLFASGHYSIAVAEAYKALDKFIAARSGLQQSGVVLMDQAFSPKSPRLFWSDRLTASEKDEQRGYHQIFSGVMLGIRNPATHEFGWVDDVDLALELLLMAQHLLRKAKTASVEA